MSSTATARSTTPPTKRSRSSKRSTRASKTAKDDVFFYVYGILHSPTYRATYSADLRKMLPRIPTVSDFQVYAAAGRLLADLHLGYESVEPYPLDGLAARPVGDPYAFFAVGAKKMSFGKASLEQQAALVSCRARRFADHGPAVSLGHHL